VKIIFFNLFCLQDCHIKTHSASGEPVPDTSQDYVLLSSSENATHTILRFRRKLNTCDEKFDVPITVRVNILACNLIRNYAKNVRKHFPERQRFEDKGNTLIMYEI
jgi:hypothetical protein